MRMGVIRWVKKSGSADRAIGFVPSNRRSFQVTALIFRSEKVVVRTTQT